MARHCDTRLLPRRDAPAVDHAQRVQPRRAVRAALLQVAVEPARERRLAAVADPVAREVEQLEGAADGGYSEWLRRLSSSRRRAIARSSHLERHRRRRRRGRLLRRFGRRDRRRGGAHGAVARAARLVVPRLRLTNTAREAGAFAAPARRRRRRRRRRVATVGRGGGGVRRRDRRPAALLLLRLLTITTTTTTTTTTTDTTTACARAVGLLERWLLLLVLAPLFVVGLAPLRERVLPPQQLGVALAVVRTRRLLLSGSAARSVRGTPLLK